MTSSAEHTAPAAHALPQAATLIAQARPLGVALDEAQADRLLRYIALIAKWNRVYNLTAVRDPADMINQHLLDCLALIPPLRSHLGTGASTLLDVGSGAGLPGVVIAVCCTNIRVTCVDAVAKKCAFIQQVRSALALPNLEVAHARVEDLRGAYPCIVSRAFASLADFTRLTRNALAPGGMWVAMKGKAPAVEVAALPPAIEVIGIEPLQITTLAADRCLVWMRPTADQRKSMPRPASSGATP